ncbi:MAG: colanic acid biosynthesis acetyltransferase WcaF, partial [Flavobacteriales bacterium]|nr:colanic acid biosynthesis acetyltransferase WcaF [Flavobacteriales bacterium]
VGNHTWIGENVWIDNLDVVEIGNQVCISQGALILSGNHDYSAVSFELIVKPIKIEDGVWIGAKSIVTQGVICRNHSVLGVDSVACDDMEEYSVYKGNPAVKIRDRHIV